MNEAEQSLHAIMELHTWRPGIVTGFKKVYRAGIKTTENAIIEERFCVHCGSLWPCETYKLAEGGIYNARYLDK